MQIKLSIEHNRRYMSKYTCAFIFSSFWNILGKNQSPQHIYESEKWRSVYEMMTAWKEDIGLKEVLTGYVRRNFRQKEILDIVTSQYPM